MRHYAVIPTKNRQEQVGRLVGQLLADQVRPVVVDNGSNPPVTTTWQYARGAVPVIYAQTYPPNLSRLWNLGLAAVANQHRLAFTPAGVTEDYVVAVLNDDLEIPPGFVQRLGGALEQYGAAAAYPDQHGINTDMVHRVPEPINLVYRMVGYAFALRGSLDLRADERLKWWYGDDDLDWRARELGGSVLVGGLAAKHLHPNESTNADPVLSAQAGLDRGTFTAKWGRAPW